MRETVALKAKRYLSEGRVIIVAVEPGRVEAKVRGDGRIYTSGFVGGQWLCDCPAVSQGCCHLRALRLITAVDLAPQPPRQRSVATEHFDHPASSSPTDTEARIGELLPPQQGKKLPSHVTEVAEHERRDFRKLAAKVRSSSTPTDTDTSFEGRR